MGAATEAISSRQMRPIAARFRFSVKNRGQCATIEQKTCPQGSIIQVLAVDAPRQHF